MNEQLRESLWKSVETALRFDGDPGLNLVECRGAFDDLMADEAWLEEHPWPVGPEPSKQLTWIQNVSLTVVSRVTGQAVAQRREAIPTSGSFEPLGKGVRERPPPEA